MVIWLHIDRMGGEGMTDIYICAYPKSGSTWLCRLLGDVLRSPIKGANDFINEYAPAYERVSRGGDFTIRQGHQRPLNGFSPNWQVSPNVHKIYYQMARKIIVLLRDPRDIITSAHHYWGMDNIHKTIVNHAGIIQRFFNEWLAINGRLIVTYEDLLTDTYKEIITILEYVGGTVSKQRITKAIDRQSFAKRRESIKRGNYTTHSLDYHLSHMRRGVAGDWVNYLSGSNCRLIKKIIWDTGGYYKL